MKTYKTLYRVAEVIHSSKFYRVMLQDAKSKEDVKLLMLDMGPEGKRWFPIGELRPTL